MAARKKKASKGAPEPRNGAVVSKAAPEFADEAFARDRNQRFGGKETLGHAGFAVYGGFLQPIEKQKDLVGDAKWRTFSEIVANVSIVAAGIRHLLNLVGKAGWTVMPAQDQGARAEEIAELCESMLYDMETPWHRIVKRIASFPFWGFSIQEWTAKKRDDGVIGLYDIESRAQHSIERWDVDLSGTVHGVEQRSVQTQETIYLPRRKLVYAVDDTLTDSPDGIGILRHVAPVAKRLQKYEQLEGFGFETDLRGIPVARAPYALLDKAVADGKMTREQADARIEFLETFVENHVRTEATGLVLDSMVYTSQDDASTPSSTHQWGIDLLRSDTNSSQEAASKAISRLTRDAARLIGVEGLLVGETGAGSLAMLREKNNVMGLLADGMLVETGLLVEKDIFQPMFRLNGWPLELMPTMQPEKLQLRALDEITASLRDMALSGATLAPDDPAINAVRSIAGLPEIDLDRAAEDADLEREAKLAAMDRMRAGGGDPNNPDGGGDPPKPGDDPEEQDPKQPDDDTQDE